VCYTRAAALGDLELKVYKSSVSFQVSKIQSHHVLLLRLESKFPNVTIGVSASVGVPFSMRLEYLMLEICTPTTPFPTTRTSTCKHLSPCVYLLLQPSKHGGTILGEFEILHRGAVLISPKTITACNRCRKRKVRCDPGMPYEQCNWTYFTDYILRYSILCPL
jgi:hypothetical protein